MSSVQVAEFKEPPHFDPLSTEQLTRIICRQFEEQPSFSLRQPMPRFDGAGLYAIYYHGESVALYQPLRDVAIPLYVGQARSYNSATGVGQRSPRPLWSRVEQHRRSIMGGGLPVEEFGVRLLRMPDVHIDMGEDGLRRGYQPVWNSVLTGFGSHEQGSTTRQSKQSKWDTVHSGRSRTYGQERRDYDVLVRKTKEKIVMQIEEFPNLPWHKSLDQ